MSFSDYLATALWSSMDENDEPLDKNYSASDIAPESLENMRREYDAFRAAALSDAVTLGNEELRALIEEQEPSMAHDFWLTRNGHGAGFWDGDWTETRSDGLELGDVLTGLAKMAGTCDLYVGDDGKIHAS